MEYLEDVPEPRLRCGIRQRVAVVLAFAVAAVLANADSATAITVWAADTLAEVLAVLDAWQDRRAAGFRRRTRTFRRVLALLDAQAVAATFGSWLAI